MTDRVARLRYCSRDLPKGKAGHALNGGDSFDLATLSFFN